MAKTTRQRIITAFFRLAEKEPLRSNFSFSEIAKEAGIARQTIYRNHYNSSEEIILDIHQEIDHKISSRLAHFEGNGDDAITFFASEIIPLLYQDKLWLRYLYSTAADPTWRPFLKRHYRQWLSQHLQIDGSMADLDQQFALDIVVTTMLAIIESWITQPVPVPPEIFGEQFKKIVGHALVDFLSDDRVRSKGK